MLGARLGGYRVVRELGAGGMGTVFLAESPGGERHAIKAVHAHLVSTPGFLERFLREAELGLQVRHENVVRTLAVDVAEIDGAAVHYMVMEYVEGKSLRELLNDLGTVPEALLREIATQVGHGLAAIHAAGIVHRDLKPENVLITDDQRVRIMDLGVAKLLDASIALTRQGEFAGTVAYAAPEVFRGEPVGPSSDQYALGIILHELATGTNPFFHATAGEVLAAHLQHVPPRIDGLSRFLAEVVATLLAKEAAGRFGSVAALHQVLVDGERSAWWRERAPAVERGAAQAPRIAVHRETGLHGRGEDLLLLRECLASAAAGSGTTVLVEGEAGIGKTRLVDAFTAELENAHVLYGCYPPTGGIGGLADAILGKFGTAGLENAVRPYLPDTPSLVPAFAAQVRHETPSGVVPLHGEALHAVCVQLMRRLAAERTTVWIVDDLQFADKENRDLVLSLARGTRGHRVLLVLLSRPGLPEEQLAHLGRLENLRRRRLERLSARDVRALLRDVFRNPSLADGLGERIARKADGVPFFLFETIRGLKEARILEASADGYVQTRAIGEIEIPSAVRDLIEARLRALSPDERALLEVGAVEGVSFDPGLVAAVLERRRIGVLRDIAEIERRCGLVRAEERRIRFDHNQVQEVLYAGQAPPLRREYHAMLAEAHPGDDPCFLALHHLKGSRPDRGLPHVGPALDRLLAAYRNEAAFELVDLALPHADPGARVDLLLRKSSRLGLVGRVAEARAAAEEAHGLAKDDVQVMRSLGARAAVLITETKLDEAEALARRRLDLARSAGDLREEAHARVQLGSITGSGRRRYADALPHFDGALELYDRLGDADGSTYAENGRGICLERSGRFEEALACHARVLARTRETGDRNREAGTLVNTGLVHFAAGRLDAARECYDQARAILGQIGNRSWEANAIGNLADIHRDTGRLAECIALNLRYVDLKSEIGERGGICTGQLSLAELYAAVGRPEPAREVAERARALAAELGDPWERRCLFVRGVLHEDESLLRAAVARSGDDAALYVAPALLELARRGDDAALERAAAVDTPLTRVMVPALKGRAGDTRAAIEAHGVSAGVLACMEARYRIGDIEEAHGILLHLQAHAPEDCRASILENVPLHLRIREAHVRGAP